MSKVNILDFDIENRPLSYLGQDFTTSDITIIAWSFGGTVECYTQTREEHSYEEMLDAFVVAYNQANIVTGHYILGHDLPIINGALLERELAPLGPTLVSDTKVHLIGRKGVSASQESLGAMLGLDNQKFQMDQAKWRSANRLEPDGIAVAAHRCISDVIEHMEMRRRLVELGWLKPPTRWDGGAKASGYTP